MSSTFKLLPTLSLLLIILFLQSYSIQCHYQGHHQHKAGEKHRQHHNQKQQPETSPIVVSDIEEEETLSYQNKSIYDNLAPGIIEYREWPFEIAFPMEHEIPNDTQYRKCTDVPILGNTCIELYTVRSNLTLGVRLIVQGRTIIDQSVSGSHVCLDQKTLLQLMEYIPALLPFKKLIDTVIKVEGFIPAKLFSVCLDLKNMQFSKTEIDGCASLDATLMCWKQKCLYKGAKDFGCFHIPLKREHATISKMNESIEELQRLQDMLKQLKSNMEMQLREN